MTIRSAFIAVFLALSPVLAAAAPTAIYQVPILDETQDFDASDYGSVAEGLTAPFFRSWQFDNTGATPSPYDLDYWVTIDSFFYDATEGTNVQFYVSTVEGDFSTSVLTLFDGTFNTDTGGTFGLMKTFAALGQTDYFLNLAADQWKGTMDFALTARVAPVPVPAALPLLAAGLGGLALVARRRRRG
ncbi:VPLPA-CTERM sorting domain-containing protein [Albimonas sp. CAU 1670]|uniref:VPLPA-CTERM sorting domain-containing protein n=1 Tax=Albimonas sp. CAU 1670 TaxID=3032599 RepID=UPI0023DB3587|nr:VPLPA-CTERM sorting domain-containing protein [Albimonas sp. CAU 1670]MDF2234265.1 VPLPA-CTERM sorting domain-containing protein [Albimonas sp. CAU 1670]